MAVRTGEAVWEGNLREGGGTVQLGSGEIESPYSYVSRFEDGDGTNPEELIGAALAGCFSMALSADLERAGFTPTKIHTTASVHLERLEEGPRITKIDLDLEATVPGIDEDTFIHISEGAKSTCPVSKALAGVEISFRNIRVHSS